MPSPIFARADALMQRRRQHTDVDDVPVLTDAVDDEDDIPILVDAEGAIPLDDQDDNPAPEISPEFDQAPAAPPVFDTAMRDILAHELARRVKQRITEELPRIIESTVRDFLAEQEMISALPPQD